MIRTVSREEAKRAYKILNSYQQQTKVASETLAMSGRYKEANILLEDFSNVTKESFGNVLTISMLKIMYYNNTKDVDKCELHYQRIKKSMLKTTYNLIEMKINVALKNGTVHAAYNLFMQITSTMTKLKVCQKRLGSLRVRIVEALWCKFNIALITKNVELSQIYYKYISNVLHRLGLSKPKIASEITKRLSVIISREIKNKNLDKVSFIQAYKTYIINHMKNL